MPTASASYSDRYCAYIDILGFRGLIEDLDRGRISVDDVYRVLSAVHSPKIPIRREADLKFQSISDAVALSTAPNAAGLDAICTAAEELSRMLLRSGYFPRGAITKGALYHDHSMVFGPALVEAYRLEAQVAKHPRILIPRAVAKDAAGYAKEGTHWREYFDGRFIVAADGPFFLHILRDYARKVRAIIQASPGASAKDDAQLILLEQMRTPIQMRYDESSDNPEYFQKIDWFVQYWNTQIDAGIDGLEPITRQPL
jgi:hypothetical protein